MGERSVHEKQIIDSNLSLAMKILAAGSFK